MRDGLVLDILQTTFAVVDEEKEETIFYLLACLHIQRNVLE